MSPVRILVFLLKTKTSEPAWLHLKKTSKPMNLKI